MHTTEAREGNAALPTGFSLDNLARMIAALDQETRVAVYRTADQLTGGETKRRTNEQAYERANTNLGLLGPTSGAGGSPVRLQERFTLENIEDAFTYHAWDPWQQDQGQQVRDALVTAAKTILRTVPQTPLRTRALNLLFDARMIANAAITHGGRF